MGEGAPGGDDLERRRLVALEAWEDGPADARLHGPALPLAEVRRRRALRQAAHSALLERSRAVLAAGAALLPRGAVRVLVADDDPLLRAVTGAVVAQVDGLVVVDEAATAAEAIGRTVAHLPDLLVLDHDLGDADAGDVVPHVRRCSPRTRILLRSGRDDVHALGAALRVDRAIDKLDGPDVLRRALVALAGR